MTAKILLPHLQIQRNDRKNFVRIVGGNCSNYSIVRAEIEDELDKQLLSKIDLLYSDNGIEELEISETEFENLSGIIYQSRNLRLFKNSFLQSLNGIGENQIKKLFIIYCHNLSLQGIHTGNFKNIEIIYLDKIKSNILGIFLLKNLKDFYSYNPNNENLAEQIVTNHFAKDDRDMLECQEELITKGYKEHAKL